MRLNLRLIVTALVACALLAACSGSDDSIAESPATTETAASATPEAAPATPTTAPEQTPSSATEAAPAEPVLDVEDAAAAWLAMWDGTELLVSDPATAEGSILAVADAAVLDQLQAIYNPAAGGDAGNTARSFENNPVAEVQPDGTVMINDCLFERPRVGNATVWYSGVATPTADGWSIASLSVESQLGCVPAAIAADVVAGYEAYWDARVEFWDPADPANPLVQGTMTGAHRELIAGLLVDHSARGLALRGRPVTHPEIIEVRSATEVAILDCVDQDPGRGLFDVETGERLADVPPVRDGQRDLTSAVMVLEEGTWKVADVQGQADVACDYAPTAQGLPVV